MPVFEVVPVIDLMGGVVVHARAGDRDAYRPLGRSILTDSPEPAAVVEGLLRLHPFRTLYIADLDAIRKQGDHVSLVRELGKAFPGLRFWVDAAFAGACSCRRFLATGLGDLVLGSESQADPELLRDLRHEAGVILSLDYKGDRALGPAALFKDASLWPRRVIAMTLARVGAGAGPDLERLTALRARRPDMALYAAGGVRGADDLAALAGLGCAGVLVASALHDGRLGRADLARLAADGAAAQGPTS